MTWWSTPRPADDAEERRQWREALPGVRQTPDEEKIKASLDAWDDELTKDDLRPKSKLDVDAF